MADYKGTERRRAQRTKLVTFCPTTFSYKDSRYRALMRDVSELGAGFKIEHSDEELVLEPNDEVAFNIKTPYGDSQCKGRIVWSRHFDETYSWGVQFTEISQDEKDPLRCLMDSPF
ncbi:MAG: hypothetical protein GF398_13735 [Chitinivibrionales bacterium]|nr:hypothetical protein [Chitinivibrionales bacterium]